MADLSSLLLHQGYNPPLFPNMQLMQQYSAVLPTVSGSPPVKEAAASPPVAIVPQTSPRAQHHDDAHMDDCADEDACSDSDSGRCASTASPSSHPSAEVAHPAQHALGALSGGQLLQHGLIK